MKQSKSLAAFFKTKVKTWQRGGKGKSARPILAMALVASLMLGGCASGGGHVDLNSGMGKYAEDFQKGDNIAVAVRVAAMSAEDIQQMDPREAVAVLNAAIGAGQDFPVESMAKFYRNLTLDPQYIAHYKAASEKWQDYAATSKLVKRTAKYWDRYDDDHRSHLLQRILRQHSKIFGFKSPTVFTYNQGGRPGCNSGDGKKIKVFTYAYARAGDLFFNTNKNVGWGNFDSTLALAVHENTHAHQGQLVKRLRKGEINADHPLWAQTALFALNGSTYINGCTDLKTYRAQPLERDAWQSQYKFIKARQAAKTSSAPKL